jgi:hypothetical protein
MIIAAAIKIGDVVTFIPAPARHHHVLHSLAKSFKGRTDEGYTKEVQGFLTSEGLFLDREEAFNEAVYCGQLKRKPGGYNGTELFSEDLW